MFKKFWIAISVIVLAAVAVASPAQADLSPDGDASAWVANDRVYAIQRVGARIYVGGRFTQVAPSKGSSFTDRAYLAAFDADSGNFISTFAPTLDGEVRSLASSADGTQLYVGGSFSSVNGAARNAVVALDPITGTTDSSFAAILPTSTVFDIEVDGDRVYLGGSFNSINGITSVARAARVDTLGTPDTTWRPRPNASVEAISIPPSGGRVYVGGNFTTLNGVSAYNLVALQESDAALIEVYDAQNLNGCSIYAPGGIRSMDSTDDRLIAVPYNMNCIMVYRPGQYSRVLQHLTDGDNQVVSLVGDRFYTGGHSFTVNGNPSSRFHAFNLDGTFDPSMITDAGGQPGLFAIHGSGPHVWMGGTIFTIGAENSIKDVGRVGPAAGEVIPTTPVGLSVTTNAGSATLSWNASSDADGIAGYRVLRGNDQLAYVTSGTSYTDTRFRDGEANLYHVEAVDSRHNHSERSAGVLAGVNGIVVDDVADQLSGVGDSVDLTISSIGGNGNVTYAATGLPSGLEISSNGQITGLAVAEGSSAVTVTATDGTDIGTSTFNWTVINESIPVGADPLVQVSSPVVGSFVGGTSATIAGVTSDDNGMAQVRISVLNRTTSQYLQSNGSFDAAFARLDATLSSPNATVSGFELAVTGLAPGEYLANLSPVSTDGGEGARVDHPFTVVSALGAAPQAVVLFPEPRTNVYGAFNIIGTATDDVGVASVQILVKEKFPTDSGLRLQDDFTFGPEFNTFDAQVTDPGAPVTQFWFSVPANIAVTNPYQVRVIVRDSDGNVTGETEISGFGIDGEYYAGRNAATPYPNPPSGGTSAQAPAVSIIGPDAVVPGAQAVVVSGSATDNAAIEFVRVRITNDIGWFLQPAGGFSSIAADLPATLNGLGTASVSYSYDAGPLSVGAYTAEVQATDSGGLQTTSTQAFVVRAGSSTREVVIGAGLVGNEYNLSQGSNLAATRNLLLNPANFGPGGVVNVDSITIIEDVPTMTQAYLDGIDILFDGWVPEGTWSTGQISLVNDWVEAGGVLVSTNDSTTFDALATNFGNPVTGAGGSLWDATAPIDPIVDGPFGSWSRIQAAGNIGQFGNVAGWNVVARNASNLPTIVTRSYGAGLVILTADEGIFRTDMSGSNGIMASNLFAHAIDARLGGVVPAPTIDSIADQTTPVGGSASLSVVASAPGQTIAYSEAGLPTGLSINTTTGVISGTATTAGVFDVTITATTSAAASTNFRWSIEAAPDTVTPSSSIAQPVANDEFAPGLIQLAGSATDDSSGVSGVRVTVRNRDTLDYLQPGGNFAAPFAFVDATIATPGGLSTGWTLDVDLPVGRYAMTSRASDVQSNNETGWPRVTFDVVEPVTDLAAPVSRISEPVAGQVFDTGSVQLTGSATDDDSGVVGVRVTVRDRDTQLWLQPGGGLGADIAFIDAVLDNVGGLSTGWTATVTLPAGRYVVTARGDDAVGNSETGWPRVNFEVADAVTDFVAPSSTVAVPVDGADLVAGAIQLSGGATDGESGVNRVRVSIRDRDTLLWLQPGGGFGTDFALVDVVLDNQGGLSTGWTIDVNLAAGRYRMTVRATDAAGNNETGWPAVLFTAS